MRKGGRGRRRPAEKVQERWVQLAELRVERGLGRVRLDELVQKRDERRGQRRAWDPCGFRVR